MRPKDFARRYLGETRLWDWLRRARYHAGRLRNLQARPWDWLRRARYHAGRLRNLQARLVARKSLYRKLQSPRFYGERYFDAPKDALRVSGYGDVYADSGEFGEVAEIAQELFQPRSVLDVGCAKGFQVAALRARGIEARGIDISEYAVRSAAPEVSPWLAVGSCTAMDYPDGSFDLLLVLETLEHVPPTDIDAAIRELRRVGSRWVWASIPCMGENPYGRDGLVEGKVRDACLELYRREPIDLAPLKHLILDVDGLPLHGHVTIASFAWWTAAFNRWGFVRRGDLERTVNERLRNAREGIWNCMVFEKAPSSSSGAPPAGRDRPAFTPVAEGVWETEPVSLPAGVYRVELEIAAARRGAGGEGLRRALACEGLSARGERINSSGVWSLRELRRMRGRGQLRITLTCASAGEEDLRFRVTCMPGLETEPLAVAAVRPLEMA